MLKITGCKFCFAWNFYSPQSSISACLQVSRLHIILLQVDIFILVVKEVPELQTKDYLEQHTLSTRIFPVTLPCCLLTSYNFASDLYIFVTVVKEFPDPQTKDYLEQHNLSSRIFPLTAPCCFNNRFGNLIPSRCSACFLWNCGA